MAVRSSGERHEAQRAALLSLLVGIVLVVAKVAVGLATGSLALLSEAVHSSLDAGATTLTFAAVKIASKPADVDHPYGHGKAENISALVETTALFGLAIYIGLRAVQRLGGPSHVKASWYGFAVVIVSMIIDANRSVVLRRLGKRLHSPALEADALNFTADLMTSAVVLVGLLMVRLGYPVADAIGSLVIAAYVAYTSVRLGRRSVDALMDRAPAGAVERISSIARGVAGVEEVRRVRFRYAGGEPKVDVVIGVSRRVPLERAHAVTEEVETAIREGEPGADVLVHVEPMADEKVVAEQVEAIAAREPLAGQIHNITVTGHPEGMRISMHAKFPGSMSLAEAHAVSERVENEIMREVAGVNRVDTHLEPLEENLEGADVTIEQHHLAKWAAKLAEKQPEVNNCHEIVISDAGGEISLVMHCEAASGLSVNAVHEASTRIENETHRRWPEVKRVTVHFEPAGPQTG